MEEKKIDAKKIFGFIIAICALLAGALMNQFGIGLNPYLGFGSVGNWLMYVGLVALFVTLLSVIVHRKKLVDERMLAIGAQSSKIVFLAIIVVAFVIMVADGIEPIDIPLGMFMAYLVNAMLLIYFISYKVMLKYG